MVVTGRKHDSARKRIAKKGSSSKKLVARRNLKRVKNSSAPKATTRPAKPALVSPPKPLQRHPDQSIKPTLLRVDQLDGHREGTGYKMAVDRIEGETVIGDLIVVFPRTRDALLRHGLKLDVDEAGDIYMTIDAFSAIHGLKTESLIRELVEISKQPPPPTPLPQVQIATPPTL